MAQRLILGITSIFIIIGCCKAPNDNTNPDNSIAPIWSTKLTIGTSSTNWSDGLGSPVIYDNIAIFPTTITYNPTELKEDNRLCGLNLENGKIEWMFPKDIDVYYNFNFIGGQGENNSYLYGDSRVIKSPNSYFKEKNEVISINNNTGELNFSIELPSSNYDPYLFGAENFVFVTDRTPNYLKIYRIDVLTRTKEEFINIPQNGDGVYYEHDLFLLGTNKGKLIFLLDDVNMPKKNCYLYTVDINDNSKYNKYDISSYRGDDIYSFLCNEIEDDIAYLNSGSRITALNVETGNIMWSKDIGEEKPNTAIINYTICGDVMFLRDTQVLIGMNKRTGAILYSIKQDGGTWTTSYKGYVYVCVLQEIWIVDPNTGSVEAKIICPEDTAGGDGFDSHIFPTFKDNKMYIMSYTSAYCYPTYPWKR